MDFVRGKNYRMKQNPIPLNALINGMVMIAAKAPT
jgi:hypothetical protein